MILEPPRAILFDWDNTLVDTWVVIHQALATTFEALDLEPWTLAETQARVRSSARDTFPQMFGARAEEAMGVYYETFEAVHLEMLQALPGAAAMLERLAADGLVLSVVSNKQGRLLRREAAHLGWSPWFHRLVGANDAARDKPARAAVELALEASGVAPGPDVWFVGDTDIDMLCAHRTGCRPVLLRPRGPHAAEFAEAAPDHHVESCAALLELVLSQ